MGNRLRFSFRVLSLSLIVLSLLGGGVHQACANSGGGGHGGGGHSKEEKKSDAKSKKDDAVTITGGQTADEPIYLHISPITLPIINDAGAQQIVTMLVDLHMVDFEKASDVQKQMPKLKDAMLQALYGGLADGSMRNANVLDIPKIKDCIMKTLTRVYGDGVIKDVLIQAVSQRKL